MRITFKKTELKKVLTVCKRFVGKDNLIQISAGKNKVHLSLDNGRTVFSTELTAVEIDREQEKATGYVWVGFSELERMASSLGKEHTELSLLFGEVQGDPFGILESNGFSSGLTVERTGKDILVFMDEEWEKFGGHGDPIHGLLKSTVPFVAKTDIRPALQYLYLEHYNGKLTAVGTDGVILSKHSMFTIDPEDWKLLLFGKDVEAFVKQLSGDCDILYKKINENGYINGKVWILSDDSSLYLDAQNVKFPDYKKFIPKGFNFICSLDRSTLINAVRLCRAGTKHRILSFHVPDPDKKDVLKIQGTNRRMDSDEEMRTANGMSVPISIERMVYLPTDIRLNADQVLSVLSVLPEQITFRCSEDTEPVLFEGLPGQEVVLMPVLGPPE